MLDLYQRYSPKPKTIKELKDILKQYGKNCPGNKLTNLSSHSQRDRAGVRENGRHFQLFVCRIGLQMCPLFITRINLLSY